jgi:hypothetical protein
VAVVAWGILANAAATGLAAAAYGAAAFAAMRRQRHVGAASAVPVLFATIAAYLVIAALRQVAAWMSVADDGWVAVDRALYLTVIVPAAFVIVPHVHVVSLVAWGRPDRSKALAAGFLVIVAVGLAFAYVGGLDGPTESDFGTDWSMRSAVTKVLLLVAIMLPGIAGSAALVWLARRLEGDGRRRVRLIGWSCLGYFVVFTLDAFGLAGVELLAARLGTAGTGFLAWWAYRGSGARESRYEPPLTPDDQMLYGR